jgi:hypothetical protein
MLAMSLSAFDSEQISQITIPSADIAAKAPFPIAITGCICFANKDLTTGVTIC